MSVKCPSCSSLIPEGQVSCPSCGISVDDSFAPTRRLSDSQRASVPKAQTQGQQSSQHQSQTVSFDSIDNARFVPGAIVAERYRIVGLLGRGGMGEVYRADDLKLGQPVALKFLPENLSQDGVALARFHREVRIARQVSHRNVCRVYDIGEVNGQQFLSMEFIRGEELSSLLRRIGRLPSDKAVEISRQICAGLAAANENGVLHRDLKPANVMIDENGNARITDFGLAGLAEDFRGEGAIEGTPAYMSPEQIKGQELTVKSDIYSLGLVLYEIFTGKKAFVANTLPELIKLRKSDASPTDPSAIFRDLDPLVERVIVRCIEIDPDKRPSSALQVAAALPGGDPLAAALAAGETPSPEMVAAASKEGILRPAVAVACLAAVLIGLALIVVLSGKAEIQNSIPMEKSPEVLAERAREINNRLGYTQRPADTAQGFMWYGEILSYIKTHDSSPGRWDVLKSGDAPLFDFWYRQSPRYLVGYNRFSVWTDNPPVDISGMTNTYLDSEGRLITFMAVPPQVEAQPQPQPQPDWSILFNEAGFDMSKFNATEPRWSPPRHSDTRAAWDGTLPGQLQIPIHIEAAAFHGKPVYFEIIYPWDRPYRQEEYQPSLKEKVKSWLTVSLLAVVVIGGALLARRNMRLGLSDRQGAFHLALYTFVLSILRGMLIAHHVPAVDAEFGILLEHLAWSLLWAVTIWLVYLALEPFVRGRWPHRIISWKRLISGEFRDPLVGRDIVLGILFGIGIQLGTRLWILVPRLFGWSTPSPMLPASDSFLGMRMQLKYFMESFQQAPFIALSALFVLLLLYIILRRDWLAAAVGWVLLIFLINLQSDNFAIDLFFAGVIAAIFIFGLMRFGLLTAAFCVLTIHFFDVIPVTTDFSTWYAGATLLLLITLVALAAYGFYTSLAGEKVFRGGLLRDD